MQAYAPDNFIIFDQAQKINLLLGNLSEAKEYFQNALKTNPSLLSYFRSLSGIGLDFILIKEGKQLEAANLLDAALDCRLKTVGEGSELIEVVYTISAIYAIKNNKNEAPKWLQKAIDSGWRDY